MKFKSYLLVVMSLLAGGLSADALYWMVEAENNRAGEFMVAQVKATNGEESYYLQIPDPSEPGASYDAIFADGVTEENPTGRSVGNGDGVWADLGDYTRGWSYSIVLWGVDGLNPVGESESLSFDELVNRKSITSLKDGVIEYASTPWSPTFAIPEPTSGLLALFGAAMLALKRRRG